MSGVSKNYLHDGASPVIEDGEEWLAGMGMDEIYTRIGAAGTLTRLTNALGSTVALADGGGSIVASYSYGAYGQVSKTGSEATSFQYTGGRMMADRPAPGGARPDTGIRCAAS